jgi:hypothetical protein
MRTRTLQSALVVREASPRGQPSGDKVHDRFHGTQEQFDQAMVVLRSKRARAYWHAECAKLPGKLRAELARLINPLFRGVTEPGMDKELT